MKSDVLTPQLFLLIVGVTVGWGTAWPVMKFVVSEIPPWTFRGVMAPFGVIVLLILARFSLKSLPLPKGQWKAMTISALFNVTGWQIFSAYGLTLLGAGHAAIITYTMPLWAVLLGIFLIGERPTLRRLLGLVLGLAGMLVLVSGEFGIFRDSPLGVLFMLGAAICWGAGTVLYKRTSWILPAKAMASWQLVVGGLPIMVIALIVEIPNFPPVSLTAIVGLIYILLIPIAFCLFSWFKIVTLVPVSVSSISTLMIPVIGVISGNLLLGEAIGWREWGSLIFVCLGLSFVLLPEKLSSTLR